MQINTLKISAGKKRKVVGRGGKKGTYSGKGNKGQKARSGAKVDPLFEGGRSTLIDHMKKKKGFKSIFSKSIVIDSKRIEDGFQNDERVNRDSLVKLGMVGKNQKNAKIKILGKTLIKKKLIIEKGISVSASVKNSIETAGGKIE